MLLELVVSIKKQVFMLATAFSLCFCIETQGMLLVFISCVGSMVCGNNISPENRETAQRIVVSHLY